MKGNQFISETHKHEMRTAHRRLIFVRTVVSSLTFGFSSLTLRNISEPFWNCCVKMSVTLH
jgi:cell division protein FtsB